MLFKAGKIGGFMGQFLRAAWKYLKKANTDLVCGIHSVNLKNLEPCPEEF